MMKNSKRPGKELVFSEAFAFYASPVKPQASGLTAWLLLSVPVPLQACPLAGSHSLFLNPQMPIANKLKIPKPARHVYFIILPLF